MTKTSAMLLLAASAAYATWVVPMPEGTSINLPIRGVEVRAINQPLPGSSSTDTVIDVGAERFININTNGVSGTVQVIASLRIAVPRAGIEQLTGLPVAQAAHDANTNAVAQIAFAKLLSTLPVIAAELASEPSNALSSP